ncbi:phosphoglycerate mutase-like protein [Gyrodon lividus]|nr:phosphoglycerate mutase-like protein [Gyrodon lividus]
MGVRTYETVPGFFAQDNHGLVQERQSHYEASTGKILPRFGLIDERQDRWTKFSAEIEQLNQAAAPGVQYKVIFLGRHGQGVHNVAEAKYGTEAGHRWAWDRYWSKLNGDGELVWGPDPQLTQLGVQQAKEARLEWEKEGLFDIPSPEKLYTSPLTRAIRTNQITFDDSLVPGLKTTIVENIREHNGVHTCDKRRKRSEIHEEFPETLFEEGFTEEDLLWEPDHRETHADIDRRARNVLDMIFDNDEEQFISVVTHGGFIGGFLRVCDHRPWILPTGGVLPVVVKSISEGELRN